MSDTQQLARNAWNKINSATASLLESEKELRAAGYKDLTTILVQLESARNRLWANIQNDNAECASAESAKS